MKTFYINGCFVEVVQNNDYMQGTVTVGDGNDKLTETFPIKAKGLESNINEIILEVMSICGKYSMLVGRKPANIRSLIKRRNSLMRLINETQACLDIQKDKIVIEAFQEHVNNFKEELKDIKSSIEDICDKNKKND